MTPPVKVLICMHQIITGGIEHCLLTLLSTLAPNKTIEFTVLSRRAVHNHYFLDFFKNHNIRLIELEKRSGKDRVWMALTRFKKGEALFLPSPQKQMVDLFEQATIILDYFNGSFHGELLSVTTPRICFMHTSFPYFKRHILDHCSRFFDSYSHFICLTKTFYNELIQLNPSIQPKCRHLYNPINVARIRELAQLAPHPPTHKYFVFLGRFHSDKDHDCVIEAMSIFVKQHPDGCLYFLGAGEKEAEYRQKIKERHLEAHIILAGVLNNPYGFLKQAVANILSSPSEGLSTVLIEAAVLGVLNIASDSPSCVSEILLEGKAGLLYPIGDHKELARLMGLVWKNEINTSSYIQAGLDAINRFDHHQISNDILQLIQKG